MNLPNFIETCRAARDHWPVETSLVATAEEIADPDNARWLDDVLLCEPTPDRWFRDACWFPVFVGWGLNKRVGSQLGSARPLRR